jgi:hypothetical protein
MTSSSSLARQADLARQPYGTIFLDRVRLLNPSLWFATFHLFDDLGVLNAKRLFHSLVRVVLISPWSLGSIAPVIPSLKLTASLLWNWKNGRCPAMPEAIEFLEERIQTHRAYRTHRYDVYLPPQEASNCKAILLIPGALIEHSAYSEIAGRLADAGFLLVVLSLEPSRVAFKSTGADPGPLRRIFRRIPRETSLQIDEWILVGHSQGTQRAILLPGELGEGSNITKVVLWANGNTPVPTRAKSVLVIQGEKDPNLTLFGDRQVVALSLPTNSPLSKEIVLPGASHQQFGSYHKTVNSVQSNIVGDVATISRVEQQDKVGNLTAAFCLGINSKTE